mgnify:CR=1 FL=1
MPKTTFTRKQFYDLVWSESLAAISRKYNISYTCLREVCTEMEIPIPPNGYWSKLKFGKPVEVYNFNETSNGKQEISLWLKSDEDSEEYYSTDVAQKMKNKSEISKKVKSLDFKATNFISDPLVVRTREYLSQKNDYRNWNYDLRKNTLDISVSIDILPRALEVMSKFIHMMKACGYAVVVKDNQTYAVINNEELEISLREKSTRITVIGQSWNHTDLKPNGKLVLKYQKSYYGKEWVDNSVLIEDRLLDIISALELIALKKKNEREELEKYRAEQRRLEAIIKELQARKENELKNFKDTFLLANRYQKANDLRNYIHVFEQNAIKNNSLTDEKQSWIEWARKKADWYDPFINAKDELLEDIDKDSLTFKSQNRW